MSIRGTLRGYAADTARAFDRAPIECAMAVFIAACMSYSVEAKHGTESEMFHLVVGALITGLIAWNATLRCALGSIAPQRRWVETGAGALVGAAFLLLTDDFELASEAWRGFMVVAGCALLAFAAPAHGLSGENANMHLRRINGRIFLRAVGTALYGVALYAGLAVALAAIDNLFELKLHRELYGHTFIWIMAVLVPWVIVGGLDDYTKPLDEKSEVARVIHRMATFLVPPLVALYFGILILYVVRIAVTHELPRNLVSPMVVAAGILGCLALVVFDPEPDARLGTRWLRYTPIVFIFLAPLGFWAVFARVGDYGWTEFRLLRVIALAALLVLALLAAVRLARRSTFALRVIPLILCVTLFAGAVMIPPVAKRDQQRQLASAIRKAGADPMRMPARADTVTRVIDGKLFESINSSAFYLERHFGPDALREVVPAGDWAARDMTLASRFNLAPDGRTRTDAEFVYGSLSPNVAVPVGTATAYRIQLPNSSAPTIARIAGDSVIAVVGGDTVVVVLSDAIRALRAPDGRGPSMAGALAGLDVHDRKGRRRGSFIILDLNAKNEDGRRVLTSVNGILTVENR